MAFGEVLEQIVPEDMPAYSRIFAARALGCALAVRPLAPPRRLRHIDAWRDATCRQYESKYPFTYKLLNPLIIAVIFQIVLLLIRWWRKDAETRGVEMERAWLEWSQ